MCAVFRGRRVEVGAKDGEDELACPPLLSLARTLRWNELRLRSAQWSGSALVVVSCSKLELAGSTPKTNSCEHGVYHLFRIQYHEGQEAPFMTITSDLQSEWKDLGSHSPVVLQFQISICRTKYSHDRSTSSDCARYFLPTQLSLLHPGIRLRNHIHDPRASTLQDEQRSR